MLPLMPEDRFVSVGSINVRYWDRGSGQVLICLHGIGTSAEIWMHNVRPLSETHRVIIPDLPGFGKSDKPSLDYSPDFMIRFIYDFLETLGIERASFLGLSLGGGIALLFTLTFPYKVRHLVLVDSAGLTVHVDWPLCLFTLPLIGEALTFPRRKGMEYALKRAVYDPSVITPEIVDLFYGFAGLPGAHQAFLSVLRSICSVRGARRDIMDYIGRKLPYLAVPACVIWGKEDRILPAPEGRAASLKIPEALFLMYDRCGHMPNLESPERFNSDVSHFLQEEHT